MFIHMVMYIYCICSLHRGNLGNLVSTLMWSCFFSKDHYPQHHKVHTRSRRTCLKRGTTLCGVASLDRNRRMGPSRKEAGGMAVGGRSGSCLASSRLAAIAMQCLRASNQCCSRFVSTKQIRHASPAGNYRIQIIPTHWLRAFRVTIPNTV